MSKAYNGITTPSTGAKIGYTSGKFSIPDNPIIPYIEGDGTGRDIWRASCRVFDAGVENAYKGKRKVAWYEVIAGEKAFKQFNNWQCLHHVVIPIGRPTICIRQSFQ